MPAGRPVVKEWSFKPLPVGDVDGYRSVARVVTGFARLLDVNIKVALDPGDPRPSIVLSKATWTKVVPFRWDEPRSRVAQRAIDLLSAEVGQAPSLPLQVPPAILREDDMPVRRGRPKKAKPATTDIPAVESVSPLPIDTAQGIPDPPLEPEHVAPVAEDRDTASPGVLPINPVPEVMKGPAKPVDPVNSILPPQLLDGKRVG